MGHGLGRPRWGKEASEEGSLDRGGADEGAEIVRKAAQGSEAAALQLWRVMVREGAGQQGWGLGAGHGATGRGQVGGQLYVAHV